MTGIACLDAARQLTSVPGVLTLARCVNINTGEVETNVTR